MSIRALRPTDDRATAAEPVVSALRDGIPSADDLRVVAERLCPADFEPIVKRAAEDFYERIMGSCEDYLRQNVEYNIGSHIAMLERENQRMRTELHEVDTIVGPPWLTHEERITRLKEMDAAKAELTALKYEIAFPSIAKAQGETA